MPLIHGKSKEAMHGNISTEMHAGKPQKQAVAIAYNMARKAAQKKMSGGGRCHACGGQINPKLEQSNMAMGGMMHEEQDQEHQPTPILGTGRYARGGRVTEEETEDFSPSGGYGEDESLEDTMDEHHDEPQMYAEGGGVDDEYDPHSINDSDGDNDDLVYSPEVSAEDFENREEEGDMDGSRNKFLRAYMIHRKMRK
jgi:hypothetical protein